MIYVCWDELWDSNQIDLLSLINLFVIVIIYSHGHCPKCLLLMPVELWRDSDPSFLNKFGALDNELIIIYSNSLLFVNCGNHEPEVYLEYSTLCCCRMACQHTQVSSSTTTVIQSKTKEILAKGSLNFQPLYWKNIYKNIYTHTHGITV